VLTAWTDEVAIMAPHMSAIWDSTGGEVMHQLRAWWYGVDTRLRAPAPGPVVVVESTHEEIDQAPLDRLVLAQRLWGAGFVMPGGVDQIMHLVKPFGVNPAMSLLDLTAGLGGPSRHISQTFDVYITGLERVSETASRGNKASADAGLGRKVPIAVYDPEKPELKAHAFDCAYSQYLTVSVGNKEMLMRAVNRSLKPRGQFSFVDFVLRGDDSGEAALDALRRIERQPILPWRVEQYTECLSNAGFDCRISVDESDRFRSQVLQGWGHFLKAQPLRALPKHHLSVVLEEAELWMTRVQLIERGVLGVSRFYAVSTQSGVG
jgi:cyclopropane fatty-acyl-phospholipid synthase-like methyltransferase